MAFEWFPLMRGAYLDYRAYFLLCFTSIFLTSVLFWSLILYLYRLYERHNHQKKLESFYLSNVSDELFRSEDSTAGQVQIQMFNSNTSANASKYLGHMGGTSNIHDYDSSSENDNSPSSNRSRN